MSFVGGAFMLWQGNHDILMDDFSSSRHPAEIKADPHSWQTIHSKNASLHQTREHETSTTHNRSSNNQCPGEYSYKPACGYDSFLDRPEIIYRTKQETDKVLKGARIVFLGDSLMRQWYETFTCDLGLTTRPQWFSPMSLKRAVQGRGRHAPPDHLLFPLQRLQRIREAFFESSSHNNTLQGGFPTNMHQAPKGMRSTLGYSIVNQTTSTISEGSNHISDDDAGSISIQVEYFHLNTLAPLSQNKAAALAINRTGIAQILFEGLLQDAEIIVFDLGVHYRGGSRDTASNHSDITTPQEAMEIRWRDFESILQVCTEISARDSSKRCIYRETLPQHFLANLTNSTSKSNFPPFWSFDNSQVQHGVCGPMDVNVHTGIFGTDAMHKLNQILQQYPAVGVIRSMDLFDDLWEWHPMLVKKKSPAQFRDCTHFCQDSGLWNDLHYRLLDAIENRNAAANPS